MNRTAGRGNPSEIRGLKATCTILASVLLLCIPARGRCQDKPTPKVIDLQELSATTVMIKFHGSITTEGKTQSLTYIQPIPADDPNQETVEIIADGGGVGSFSHEIVKEGLNSQIVMTWQDFEAREINYEIRVKVRRDSFKTPLVETKRGKDDAMLNPGTLTSTSQEIKKKSAQVVKGSKSDLESVLRLAAWIYDTIQYDVHYSQSKKDKTAPVVFKKKQGTCDELSHLFIAMVRAAGIPAREVSGLAFNGKIWGFHSWSEVKLEDRWVSVDATNMQVGFVDATHLAFARDADDAKFEQKISRLGIGAFSTERHDMDVRIWKASKLSPQFEVELSALPPEIPPTWKFTMRADIKNASSSWVAGPIKIVIPKDFKSSENLQKTFLVAPGGKTTVLWDVISGGTFEPDGIYIYKLGAVTFPRIVAQAKLTIATKMIQAISAMKNPDGTFAAEVNVKNPFDKKARFDIEVCIYPSWELEGKEGCETQSIDVDGSADGKAIIESPFVPESNFAIEVFIESGGLSQRRVLKVNIGK